MKKKVYTLTVCRCVACALIGGGECESSSKQVCCNRPDSKTGKGSCALSPDLTELQRKSCRIGVLSN
jgi:NADH:ubiquinone oxidoreductase subunit E